MSSHRHGSSVTISLFLSYLLIVLLSTPFATNAAKAKASKTVAGPTQDVAAPHREGELLVKFRDGVSQKDQDTVLANHGVSRRKQLRGSSRLEKVELPSGRDTKTTAFELLQNSQVEFAEPNFVIS